MNTKTNLNAVSNAIVAHIATGKQDKAVETSLINCLVYWQSKQAEESRLAAQADLLWGT